MDGADNKWKTSVEVMNKSINKICLRGIDMFF